MLTISTSPVVGMVDGHGYDGRQKDAICDIRGPCLTIRSIFKPVCHWFRLIGHVYELLRCLDVEIWWFSWWQQTDGQTNRLLYPCACARGKNHSTNVCVYVAMHHPHARNGKDRQRWARVNSKLTNSKQRREAQTPEEVWNDHVLSQKCCVITFIPIH